MKLKITFWFILVFLITGTVLSKDTKYSGDNEVYILSDTSGIFEKFVKPIIPQSLIDYSNNYSKDSINYYDNPVELFFGITLTVNSGKVRLISHFGRLNYHHEDDSLYNEMWKDCEHEILKVSKEWVFKSKKYFSIFFLLSMYYLMPEGYIDRMKILRITK